MSDKDFIKTLEHLIVEVQFLTKQINALKVKMDVNVPTSVSIKTPEIKEQKNNIDHLLTYKNEYIG